MGPATQASCPRITCFSTIPVRDICSASLNFLFTPATRINIRSARGNKFAKLVREYTNQARNIIIAPRRGAKTL